MPLRSHRFPCGGVVVLGVLCSLMILAVVPPPARAASSVTTHTVIITQQGAVFSLNPCASSPDTTTFLLQPGDTLAFENRASVAVQVHFGDLSDEPGQILKVPANGTASLVPQVRGFFSYSVIGSGKACFGRVPITATVLLVPSAGTGRLDPCFGSATDTQLVLVPGDTLAFQNNLATAARVFFTDTTNDTEQTLTVSGGGTVSLIPPANIIFTYAADISHQLCVGRVLAIAPSTLPPTGGGPIPAASARCPGCWRGARWRFLDCSG